MRVDLTVHAEILAFRDEILVVEASRWILTNLFLFESDSESVITWVAHPTWSCSVFIIFCVNVVMCLSPILYGLCLILVISEVGQQIFSRG